MACEIKKEPLPLTTYRLNRGILNISAEAGGWGGTAAAALFSSSSALCPSLVKWKSHLIFLRKHYQRQNKGLAKRG